MTDTSHATPALIDQSPEAFGVILRRGALHVEGWETPKWEIIVTNLAQTVIHHSPCGYEWGYSGSGPADLALNILARFLPVGADGQHPERCWSGIVSRGAWEMHQEFEQDIVSRLPRPGGDISANFIRIWIAGRLPALKRKWRGQQEPAVDLNV